MEMRTEDRPPEEIWLDQEKLGMYFEELREKWKSGSSSSGSQWEKIEGPVVENSRAKDIRRRVAEASKRKGR